MSGNLLWETQPVSKSRNGERHEEVLKSRYAGAGLMFELQLLSIEYDTMPERSHVIVKASAKGADYAQAEFYVVNDDWVMELPLWSPEADEADLESALIEFADREVMKYAAGQARNRMGQFASGGVSNNDGYETALQKLARERMGSVNDKRPAGPWQDKWVKETNSTMTPLQKNAFKARTTVALRKTYPNWTDEQVRKEAAHALAVKENWEGTQVNQGKNVYSLKGDNKYTVETKITDDALLNKFLGDVSDLKEFAPIPQGVKIFVKDGDNLANNSNGTTTKGSTAHPFEAQYVTPVPSVYGYGSGKTVTSQIMFPSQLGDVEDVRRVGPQPMQFQGPIQINIPQGGVEKGYSKINVGSVGEHYYVGGNHTMVGLVPDMSYTLAHEWGHAVSMKYGGYRPNYSGRQPYVSWLSYQSDSPKFMKLYKTYSEKPLKNFPRAADSDGSKRMGGLSDYALKDRGEGFAEIWSNNYLSQRFDFAPQEVTKEFVAQKLGDN